MLILSPRHVKPTLALILLSLVLTGCSRSMDDLRAYISNVKARTSSSIDPIPQMRPYEPFVYSQTGERSPFEPIGRDDSSSSSATTIPPNTLQPDLTRNSEPLEEFPLDALRLRGTLEIRQQIYALISAPDGIVHRATYGDHMGQNFGKIVGISDAQVQLEEIVADGLGGYIKRTALVSISEEE